jgi:hypothetical protein
MHQESVESVSNISKARKFEYENISEIVNTKLGPELDTQNFDHEIRKLSTQLIRFCKKNKIDIYTLDKRQLLVGLCLMNEWLNLFKKYTGDKPLQFMKLKSIINRFKVLTNAQSLEYVDQTADDYTKLLNTAIQNILSQHTNSHLSELINTAPEEYFPYLITLKSELGIPIESPNPFVIKILDISEQELADYEIAPNKKMRAGGFADINGEIVQIGIPYNSSNMIGIVEHEIRHAFSKIGLMHGKNYILAWGVNEAVTEAGVTNPTGYSQVRSIYNRLFSDKNIAELSTKSYFDAKFIYELNKQVFNLHGAKGVININFMAPTTEIYSFSRLYKSVLIDPEQFVDQKSVEFVNDNNVYQESESIKFDVIQYLDSTAIRLLYLEDEERKNRSYQDRSPNMTRATQKEICLHNTRGYLDKIRSLLGKEINISCILSPASLVEFKYFIGSIEKLSLESKLGEIKNIQSEAMLWTNFINKQIQFALNYHNFNPVYSNYDFRLTKLLYKHPHGYKA